MPPHRDNTGNVNARNANVARPIPDQKVSNTEFGNSIQMLAQIMTNKNNRAHDHVSRVSLGSLVVQGSVSASRG